MLLEVALVLALLYVGLRLGAVTKTLHALLLELETARWERGVRDGLRGPR